MNTAEQEKPVLYKIIGDIEEVVEHANFLAIELAVKACENNDTNNGLVQELSVLRHMADRAMTATEEIERLIRGLRTL